jgi:outer membrane lipoprotein-sorting protein
MRPIAVHTVIQIAGLITCLLTGTNVFAGDEQPDARQLVQSAMDHWRGQTSFSEMTMTIHRPDWERSMTMEAWSRGDKHSLVRVVAPKKDLGNATLLDDGNMWTFSPKVNRVIKIPSSMMGQSWMGSDFSNKDISKSTDILDQYDHHLDEVIEADGHTLYTVTAVPHEDAAVVWGKEVLIIRDDFILLEEQYWDQDGILVKLMKTTEVAEMGGRSVARIMRMSPVDTVDEWTELSIADVQFDIDLPANTFTLSNLRNPRR